jgi:hypothetical protein
VCFRRRDIGGSLRAGPDTQPDARPLLQPHLQLLAEDSVISTFRVSSAEHPRAPGQPDSANLHDSPRHPGRRRRRPGVLLMDEAPPARILANQWPTDCRVLVNSVNNAGLQCTEGRF